MCAPLLSLGLWSVIGQISRSARVTCGCSLVQASGLSLGLAFCKAYQAFCFCQSQKLAGVGVGLVIRVTRTLCHPF